MIRNILSLAFVATLPLCLSPSAWAQQSERFPSQPVKIVVPFAPGGSVDLIAWLVANESEKVLGGKVIVENRGGAGTLIGTRAVVQSRPDGYTLLLSTSTVMTNALAHKTPGYAMSDFTLAMGVGITHCILATGAQSPYKNLAELVAHARKSPGRLNVSGVAGGGVTNLVWDRFRRAVILDVVEIMYPGGAQAMQAILGGQTQLFLSAPPTQRPGLTAGTARGLAVTGDERLGLFPDIPTFKEQGFANMGSCLWYGIFAPAKTPAPVIGILRQTFDKAASADAVRTGFVNVGVEPWTKSVVEFERLLAEDQKALKADIESSGFKVE